MGKFIGLIWKNAVRNRRRSLLTIASIAASFCLLGVLGAIYQALFNTPDTSPTSARRLVTRNRISLAQVLPISYKNKIRSVPGVKVVMGYQWFGGVYKEPKNFFARFACEPKELLELYPEYKLSDDQRQAFLRDRAGTIIGQKLADKYNIKVGERVTLKGDIFPVNLEFVVRGIFETPTRANEEIMWFNIEYLWQSLPAGRRDFAGTFLILADNVDSAGGIGSAVDGMFRNSVQQTRTESEKAFAASFVNFLGNVKLYLFAISAAITFTILLVCGNTIAMSVRERVREVGILKVLGFTNGEVLGMILGEAMVISLIGGIIGCGIASLLAAFVRNAAGFGSLETTAVTPPIALGVVAAAVFMGFVAAIIPAVSASKTRIVDAMKYTG
jgi:putative ABC transport system permease protein